MTDETVMNDVHARQAYPAWLTPLDGDAVLDSMRRAMMRRWDALHPGPARTPHPLGKRTQPNRATGE